MSSKNRHVHQCDNHPEKRSYHTCLKCGSRLCGACVMIVRGDPYCFNPACRPEELRQPAAEGMRGAVALWKLLDPAVRRLIVGSATTMLLCGLVFTTWALREVWELYHENSALRTSRYSLIEQLTNRNRETQSPETAKLQQDPAPLVPQTIVPGRTQSAQVVSPPGLQQRSPVQFNISNGPTDRRIVSLTFDGGSLANITGAILDTLASRDAAATMFLTGEFIRKFPDITRRILAAGHECGNHTAGHRHLTSYETDRTSTTLPSVNARTLTADLRRADELFFNATGSHFTPVWRAPYGEYNRDLCRWAFEAGYLHIAWRQGKTWRLGLDSNDWIPDEETDGYHTPAEFLDKVVSLARTPPDGINGGILLFHLGTERKNPDTQVHRVLGTLIDTLRADGYRIVPVSEMVATSGVDLASVAERSHIQ